MVWFFWNETIIYQKKVSFEDAERIKLFVQKYSGNPINLQIDPDLNTDIYKKKLQEIRNIRVPSKEFIESYKGGFTINDFSKKDIRKEETDDLTHPMLDQLIKNFKKKFFFLQDIDIRLFECPKKYDLDECEIKFTKKIINIPTFYNKKFKVVKGNKRLDFNKKGGSSSSTYQNNSVKTGKEFEKRFTLHISNEKEGYDEETINLLYLSYLEKNKSKPILVNKFLGINIKGDYLDLFSYKVFNKNDKFHNVVSLSSFLDSSNFILGDKNELNFDIKTSFINVLKSIFSCILYIHNKKLIHLLINLNNLGVHHLQNLKIQI